MPNAFPIDLCWQTRNTLDGSLKNRDALLPTREQVECASGRERAPPVAAGGRGKCPTQMTGGGCLARQAHADRGPAKNSLWPGGRRELAHWFRDTFGELCAGQQIWELLRRQGWLVNRHTRPSLVSVRWIPAPHASPATVAHGISSVFRSRSRSVPTERWSMEVVHDTLADGRPFRILQLSIPGVAVVRC